MQTGLAALMNGRLAGFGLTCGDDEKQGATEAAVNQSIPTCLRLR